MKRAPLKAGIIAASALFTVSGWGLIAATAPAVSAAPSNAVATSAGPAAATPRGGDDVDEGGRAFARSFEREGRRSRTGTATTPPSTGGSTGSGSAVTPPNTAAPATPSSPSLGSGSTTTTQRATTRSRSSR